MHIAEFSAAITFVHNGKPAILFPHYEEMFYNPFYSNQEDISQRIPNKLIVDIYELNDIAKGFELVQSTPIDVVKSTEDGVIASYYSIGAFRYREDIGYGEDGKEGGHSHRHHKRKSFFFFRKNRK